MKGVCPVMSINTGWMGVNLFFPSHLLFTNFTICTLEISICDLTYQIWGQLLIVLHGQKNANKYWILKNTGSRMKASGGCG